ncbi:MAG: 1,4-alpha-glucan branching protein GlgB, partial [Chitinophagaceae bacterium]
FEWVDGGNAADSILVYSRKGNDPKNDLVIVLNLTPVTRDNYRIGLPAAGEWKEIFNSDASQFWGSGKGNYQMLKSEKVNWHIKEDSINISLPPLGAVVFKRIS